MQTLNSLSFFRQLYPNKAERHKNKILTFTFMSLIEPFFVCLGYFLFHAFFFTLLNTYFRMEKSE